MKILSIDFDIIMYPCIKLYNDKVGGDCNPTELWQMLEQQYELQNFVNYDAKYLLKLAEVIKTAVDNGAKLVPITEHQEIVDYLVKTETYEEDKYDVVNIDFHHDIWYREEDKNSILSFDQYNCSNWLGYLFLKEKTNSIKWACAGNSGGFPTYTKDDEMVNIIDERVRLLEWNDKVNDVDYVFLCLSPQWVPYKFHHLYQLLIKLCSSKEE